MRAYRTIFLAAALASAYVSTTAFASEAVSAHGGRIVEAGSKHIEAKAVGGAVEVYVSGHDGKAVDATTYKGLAILMAGGKPARILLTPAGGDRLTGKADADIAQPLKGAVQLTAPNGEVIQGKFD